MARRKKTEEQMKLFDEGGLKDEGGTVDPVSGNKVPAGSTKKEVRDDIPAQLSEGEFVFPADVVRYIGLENLMELRQKAKRGLAQMEAMGQMGNSEEATMDDDIEYNAQIDELIENFDPDNPETMEFSQGGVVYAQRGMYIPPQQFSQGYMPPNVPQQQAQYPQYGQMIQQPAQGAVSGAPPVEDKQYIGPNGEMITIRFVNGKPQQNVPLGFKVYKPEEAAPEVVQPTVAPVQSDGDSAEQRQREAEREAQMARDKSINTTLSKLDPEFAKLTAEDPFMTGKPTANIAGAIYSSVQTHLGRTKAIENIAKQYGINLAEYENTGLAGALSKYDDERFANDVKSMLDDPNFEEKSKARKEIVDRYERESGDSVENLDPKDKAVMQNEMDEVEDAIDRGEIGGGSDGPSVDSFSGMSEQDQETQTQEDRDEMEDDRGSDFSFFKGGAVQQTTRALKSSRKN